MAAETITAARRRVTEALNRAGIETAALDARLLLQAATGLSHAGLIQAEEEPLALEAFARLDALLQRRCAREPISRILGSREFSGLDFALSPATLDPRPDTETLVDLAHALATNMASPRILDLGTGSGAIIVSLMHHLPNATGVATDISAEAINTARSNAQRHDVASRISFLCSDWFASLQSQGPFDIIVSNPPYITEAELDRLSPEVRLHDPRLALVGGEDGLECYRRIIAEAPAHLVKGGHILLEIGQGQEKRVRALLDAHGFVPPRGIPPEQADLGGVIRVVAAGLPG